MLDHLSSLEIEYCIQNKQTNKAMQDSSLDEKKIYLMNHLQKAASITWGQPNMGCYCSSRLQDSFCLRHVFSCLFLRVRCRAFLRWALSEGYSTRHNARAARRWSLWCTGVSCCKTALKLVRVCKQLWRPSCKMPIFWGQGHFFFPYWCIYAEHSKILILFGTTLK